MAYDPHRTAPDPKETGWPRGIPYIIGNEACERFSYYGMRSILQVYLTFLYSQVALEGITPEQQATSTVHLFYAGVYAFPMIGALIADRFLGKYRVILWLSLVYCAGHGFLAVFEDSLGGVLAGLMMIAIGSGGIKSCVSAHVGDQFGAGNWSKLPRVYQIFYFSVNFGSFFASLLIPYTKETLGVEYAFGIPGILMFIATIFFWLGRNTFVHVPAKPGGRLGLLDAVSSTLIFMALGCFSFFGDDTSTWVKLIVPIAFLGSGLLLFGIRQEIARDDGFLAVLLLAVRRGLRGARDTLGSEPVEGFVAVLKILSVFVFISMFWALFDQHSTTWIRQAELMDRQFLIFGWEFEVLPSQTLAWNPLFVMILIPFTGFFLYPLLDRCGFAMTPLRRISLGMYVGFVSFVVVAMLQDRIEDAATAAALDPSSPAAQPVHLAWQIIPQLLITLSEVMISITGLEFAYSQAPKRMKSTIMGFWLLTIALGNIFVSLLTKFLPEMTLARNFWLFTWLMLGAAVLVTIRSAFYRYREYTQ